MSRSIVFDDDPKHHHRACRSLAEDLHSIVETPHTTILNSLRFISSRRHLNRLRYLESPEKGDPRYNVQSESDSFAT
jgi:hypothetical protein